MEPLKVDVVHFYPRDNAQQHNTIKFEVINEENPTTAIVRRGRPFSGVVRFDRALDEAADVVQLLFTLGDNPTLDTQGSALLRRDAVSAPAAWTARLVDVQAENAIIEVSTPVSLPVGAWALRVVTRRKDSAAREVYDYDQDLYILFNPWNADDQTSMEDTELLQEYVLNDVGKIWVGPVKTTRGKPWLFGQFDAIVLPACMFMLDRAGIPFHKRGDPVQITRTISKIVNSNDDAGVLIGRWDGEYSDGTAPAEWVGSADILQQYLETQAEVPYGQCWVFAGVVTTVCRALGIPSRVVTNMVSAHDANGSLTVDKYYSEDMADLDYDPNNPAGADSIWNYHVWNDVWMARPDLPAGFGGWQAIDATPQETSSGFFQCGPAPLEAIKQGITGFNYDVEFMLASVNADLMRWRRDPEAEIGFSMVDTNSYHIGRMVLTKKPYIFDPLGDEDREDVTQQYKHREGSAGERVALMNGVTRSDRAKRYYAVAGQESNDVTFSLREIDNVGIGQDFRIAVDIDNLSGESRNVKAVLSAASVFYNGIKASVVKKVEGKVHIGPGKREEISVLVTADDYLPALVEYGDMKLTAMATVEETRRAWAADDDFQVVRPTVDVKFNEDLTLNQVATCHLSFVNPLPRALTGGSFRAASGGVAGRAVRAAAPDAPPGGLVSAALPLTPTKQGVIHIVVTFTSADLRDVTGAAAVEVFEG